MIGDRERGWQQDLHACMLEPTWSYMTNHERSYNGACGSGRSQQDAIGVAEK